MEYHTTKPVELRYVLGDLFRSKAHVIVHGCNAQGVMGSGVAKYVREYYPEAYQRYRHEYENSGLKLGDFTIVVCRHKFYPQDDVFIVNAITQDNYGRSGTRYVDYDAVRKVFKDLNWVAEQFPDTPEIALPRIGAGLGGGDWDVIAGIIEEEAKIYNPVVFIPEFEKEIYDQIVGE